MKYLRLIIPLQTFSFPTKFLFLFVIAFGSSCLAYAIDELGCRITLPNSDRLYYIPDNVSGRANPPYTWISDSEGGGGYHWPTNASVARCLADFGISCTVYKFGSTGTAPADVLYTGVYARMYDCPLDRYTIIFLVWSCFCSLTFIKGRTG